ncbi:hypothetical protein ABFV54_27815, partial [Pseudomonas syringae]|uniref:hypothetical protein n=1 Tax=Pseudomonas syringae TaxID=317 RepID=UPI0034D79DCE
GGVVGGIYVFYKPGICVKLLVSGLFLCGLVVFYLNLGVFFLVGMVFFFFGLGIFTGDCVADFVHGQVIVGGVGQVGGFCLLSG